MPAEPSKLPYRPCVGIMLFNRDGMVWIGHRVPEPHKFDAEGEGHWWQMPQGGIDKGEDPVDAAFRELAEESGIRSVSMLATSKEWYRYDLPDHLIGKAWNGKYRGQEQLWVACRFEGDDEEINLAPGEHRPEFDDWQWIAIDRLPELIVPFKRAVYERLVREFRHLAVPVA